MMSTHFRRRPINPALGAVVWARANDEAAHGRTRRQHRHGIVDHHRAGLEDDQSAVVLELDELDMRHLAAGLEPCEVHGAHAPAGEPAAVAGFEPSGSRPSNRKRDHGSKQDQKFPGLITPRE
jgi:hypothetical protein